MRDASERYAVYFQKTPISFLLDFVRVLTKLFPDNPQTFRKQLVILKIIGYWSTIFIDPYRLRLSIQPTCPDPTITTNDIIYINQQSIISFTTYLRINSLFHRAVCVHRISHCDSFTVAYRLSLLDCVSLANAFGSLDNPSKRCQSNLINRPYSSQDAL